MNEYKEGKLEKNAVAAYERWMKADPKFDEKGEAEDARRGLQGHPKGVAS